MRKTRMNDFDRIFARIMLVACVIAVIAFIRLWT